MDMRRREFLGGLGIVVKTWPRAARAQQSAMPVMGYLGASSPMRNERFLTPYRWADDHHDRLPALAVDLVRRQVTAIVAFTHLAAVAAKAATTTIFQSLSQPLVTQLRPASLPASTGLAAI